MNTAEKLGEFETRPGVTYATHDSVALAGDLYLPKGAGPFPALVGVHGGGWVQGARGQFQHWGKYLAARGVALFAISYRLRQARAEDLPARGAGRAGRHPVRARQRQGLQHRARPHRRVRPFRRRQSRRAGGARRRSPLFAGGYPQDAHAKVSTEVKVFAGVYGVYDVAEMWGKYNIQSPKQNNIELFTRRVARRTTASFISTPRRSATRSRANNKVAVHLERRHRGRPGRPPRPHRRLRAGAEAGRLLRAHHHPAGRAALLGQRSDRRAGQLLGLPRAAADAVSGGEAMTGDRQLKNRGD